MTAPRVTLAWVAKAVGGRVLAGAPDVEIGRCSIDSRTSEPGDFFVAIVGPRFDGHDFITDASERGATGALVARGYAAERQGWPAGLGVVGADDTSLALQGLARAIRMAVETQVVAITGSAGKTTTKEAIAAFLGRRHRVVRNQGNLNNAIGLPLSLMQLRDEPDIAVMELGMSRAGEIRTLVDIARPDIRVWMNVGNAHLGFFDSPEELADAKAEIIERSGEGDVLVCNADDPRIMSRVTRFPGRTLTFGCSPGATVSASQVESLGIDGMRAKVSTPKGKGALQTGLLGRGNLSNVLAATTVALECGAELNEVLEEASRLTAMDRRGVVHRLARGVTLIDDSYNSSPAALTGALSVLAGESRASRKVAVLGEMLELGHAATALHEACGLAAQEAGLHQLVTVGGAPARVLASAAVSAGMPASAVRWAATSAAAADLVAGMLQPGDLVLVKGSRGIGVDTVASRIQAEFA